MNFEQFLDQSWNEHGKYPKEVASRFPDGMKIVTSNDQIPQFAQLMTHVYGEHLGQWREGVLALEKLRQVSCFDSKSESEVAVKRSIAVLEVAGKLCSTIGDYSKSDQIRIFAMAASAVSEHQEVGRAIELFRKALELAQLGVTKDDAANRALAITGNNLACTLEEKSNRTAEEKDLMILAAETARKFWEVAGNWMHVERAEYRLSFSYRQVGDLVRSLEHAQTCLEICRDNEAPALEFFFGYEALALVERARSNEIGFGKAIEQMKAYFERLSDDDKGWCKSSLEKLTVLNQ